MCCFGEGFNPQTPEPDFDQRFEEQLERMKAFFKEGLG
jgi:hypothetical protein